MILVVDDEPFVLGVISNVLQRADFEVLSAASAEEALRIGSTRREPIHLLLTDVLMPSLNGPGLAEEFALLHPETQPLFMAGLPDHPEVVRGVAKVGKPLLPKPFGPQLLISKVNEVLAGA